MEMDKYKQTIRKYHDDMCDNYYQLVRNMKSRMIRRLDDAINDASRRMVSQRAIDAFCNDCDIHMNTMLNGVIFRQLEQYCEDLETIGRVETQVEEEIYNLKQGNFETKIARMVEEKMQEYSSELKMKLRKSELDERMVDDIVGEATKAISSTFGMFEQEFMDKRLSTKLANNVEALIAESKMEKENEQQKEQSDGFIPATPMPSDVIEVPVDFDIDLMISVSNPSLVYYKNLNTREVRQVTDSQEYLKTILSLEGRQNGVLDQVRNNPILIETIEKANEMGTRKNEKKDPALTDPFLEAEKAKTETFSDPTLTDPLLEAEKKDFVPLTPDYSFGQEETRFGKTM